MGFLNLFIFGKKNIFIFAKGVKNAKTVANNT